MWSYPLLSGFVYFLSLSCWLHFGISGFLWWSVLISFFIFRFIHPFSVLKYLFCCSRTSPCLDRDNSRWTSTSFLLWTCCLSSSPFSMSFSLYLASGCFSVTIPSQRERERAHEGEWFIVPMPWSLLNSPLWYRESGYFLFFILLAISGVMLKWM